MQTSALFLFNSATLGVGLAMDAFSVSLVNGMNEPGLALRKMLCIAGVYGAFQAVMPMLGWLCTHTLIHVFTALQGVIPWVSLVLLSYIGVRMIARKNTGPEEEKCLTCLTLPLLLLQGVATSIDALSVGFAIAGYSFAPALECSFIIASVTFAICLAGVVVGKKLGDRLAGKASVFGGVILIAVGAEIFLTHML